MRTETPSVFRKHASVREGHGYLGDVMFSIAVISAFSLFVALSKGFLRVPLHIPGHSAVYVIPFMLLGRVASRNRFGGTGIGGLSGSLMAFLGLGGGFLLGIPRYLFMGVVIDLLLWKGSAHKNAVHLVAAGALANFAKFFVGLIIASLVGIPVFFIHLGLTYSVLTHLTFGAMGGFVAFGVMKALKRVKNQKTIG